MNRARAVALATAGLLAVAGGCIPPSPVLEPHCGAQRTESDFHTCQVLAPHRPAGDAALSERRQLEWQPRLFLLGADDVEVRIRVAGTGATAGAYRFAPGDRFAIVDQQSGRPLEVAGLRVCRGWLCGTVRQIPPGPGGYYALVVDQTARGGARQSFGYAFRSVDRIRVALTFDDGPTPAGDSDDGRTDGSPTARVLDVLASWRHGEGKSRQGLSAAFFVLTSPEWFMGRTFRKGETADGLALMARAGREGHLLAVHWGGRYRRQNRYHTSRVDTGNDGRDIDGNGQAGEDCPYDADGDGRPDGENALESDLRGCLARIREASGQQARWVRPPLYVWQMDGRPEVGRRVLETYARLGLKMVLADARLGDGGYRIVSSFSLMKHVLNSTLRRAVQAGHADIVLAMHDSNPWTAARLEQWLERTELAVSGIELGGRRLRPGRDFEFVSSREELAALLERKRCFAMAREVRPAREPGRSP